MNGEFKIDIRKAIRLELEKERVLNQEYNFADTITDKEYYSHSASRNDLSKAGRQFIEENIRRK